MALSLIVCISSAGASVALWRGRLTNCAHFAADDNGLAAFADLLRPMRNVPVYVMADTVEEDYRFETLPHAVGRDRREMVDRRLKQLYRTTPFYAGYVQARERDLRRDDRYLLTAITDADLLQPWLAAIEARDLPIAGVFSVPVVTPAVSALLKLKSQNVLVISKHAAGMRQTFLRDGKFRFSRLTPFRGLPETNRDAAFAAEIGNTRMYLNALQVTAADDMVVALILDQDDSLGSLVTALASSPVALRVERLGRTDLASRLKLAPVAMDATPDALHLHLMAKSPPAENVAPASLRRGFLAYRAGRALLAASGGVALVAAVWFGLDLYQVRQLETEIGAAVSQTDRYQALYAELTRQFPASPVTSTTMKQTVDAFERIRARARTPEVLFQIVSDALEAEPALVLTSLSWRHAKTPDGSAPGNAQATAPLRQFGVVSGELPGFSGDYRTAVGAIREFAERLRKNPRVSEAKITKLPLDESSRQSLSGSTSISTERALNAQFEIAITLRDDIGA